MGRCQAGPWGAAINASRGPPPLALLAGLGGRRSGGGQKRMASKTEVSVCPYRANIDKLDICFSDFSNVQFSFPSDSDAEDGAGLGLGHHGGGG